MKKKVFLAVLILTVFLSLAFKSTTVNAFPLFGKFIILDVGHGNLDPGSIYKNEYEKDYNLLFANTLKENLEKLGASVIMTREGDYDLSNPSASRRKKSDFNNRIKLIEEDKPDMYISLHMNYLTTTKYHGAQVFYSEVNPENQKIAETIQKKVNKISGSDRETKKIGNDKYMYRNIETKGVLLEFGFLSSYEDRKNLKNENYRNNLAEAVSKSVITYFQN